MNGLLFFTGGIILWGGEYTSPGEKGEKEKYKKCAALLFPSFSSVRCIYF
jgi:hypothetical protein